VGPGLVKIMVRGTLTVILLAHLLGASCAAEEAPDWRAVSALFVEHCVMCHAAHGAALGLRLDSYEAALAGGERGPVLIAGDAEGSELVRRLRGDSRPRMPFLSYLLPPELIELVVRWVEAGLPRDAGRADGPTAAR
jgi:mono/diheme cytochrome c family protein